MAEKVVNLDPVDPQVPISREWAAACKMTKDTVLSWNFAPKLEQHVCSEAGFQVQLNNAYTFASSVTTTSDARGESCVTLTLDAVEKKLLMFSSAVIDSISLSKFF